jgi:hypothetical protein
LGLWRRDLLPSPYERRRMDLPPQVRAERIQGRMGGCWSYSNAEVNCFTSKPRTTGEVQRANANRLSAATRASNYLDSEPVLLSGPNLQALADSVARVLGAATWKGNEIARCSEMADKAPVDLTLEIGVRVHVPLDKSFGIV